MYYQNSGLLEGMLDVRTSNKKSRYTDGPRGFFAKVSRECVTWDVAEVAEENIRETCEERDIGVIDMAVNVGHV